MVVKTYLFKINVGWVREINEIEFKSCFFGVDVLEKGSFIHKLFFKFDQVKI